MKFHTIMPRSALWAVAMLLTTNFAWSQNPPPASTPPQEQAPAETPDGAQEIRALLEGLPVGTPGEYERIPGIWQIAIAAGKRNNTAELVEVLDISLPKADEPLYDWQAVVVGGGVINGVSMAGEWPKERLAELFKERPELKARWERSIPLAIKMSHNKEVRDGARYDALRMLGATTYDVGGEHLLKYLKGENRELQQGAVSGLVDIDDDRAVQNLIEAFNSLEVRNKAFAFEGLLRSDARREKLKAAIDSGKIAPDSLTEEQRDQLKKPAAATPQ